MKDIIKVIRNNKFRGKQSNIALCKSRAIVSIILCIAATAMLIMNIINHSDLMTLASVVLVVGFSVSAILAGVFKEANASALIIAILVCFVLSLFAISGGNEGFAILWILLVPMFSIPLIGVGLGLAVSTFFLVFLVAIFATPLRSYFIDKYTLTFISKFPILYLADYAIATFFSLQKEYLQRKLEYQAYTDGMTGVFNRRMFMEQLKKLDKNDIFSIISLDLNGLKKVNDELGHDAGDDFICNAAKLCSKEFENNAIVCRIGGDEFAIIAYDDIATVKKKVENLHELAKDVNSKVNYNFAFSTGISGVSQSEVINIEKLIKTADEEMYKNKREFYQALGNTQDGIRE